MDDSRAQQDIAKAVLGERFTPEPGQASATGRDAAAALEQAAANMNQRLYTQREVEQMIQFWEDRSSGERKITKDREGKDDGLRSFPVTLPQLPEAHMQHASLEAGDWLTQVRPLIADVSGSAAEWWARVEKETAQAYQQWLNSAPLGKLKIQPPDAEALAQGHERLAQRVRVMLMQAVPADMKKELVASRQMDAPSILFKIYQNIPTGRTSRKAPSPSPPHKHTAGSKPSRCSLCTTTVEEASTASKRIQSISPRSRLTSAGLDDSYGRPAC